MVLTSNRAADTLLGIENCAPTRLLLTERLSADSRSEFEAVAGEISITGQHRQFDWLLYSIVNEPVPVSVSLNSHQHHPGQLNWLLSPTGNQRPQQLDKLQSEIAHMARLSTLGGMASGIAHELNQPLTAIISYNQACLSLLRSQHSSLSQRVCEALEQVDQQGQRASSIIRRLRYLARHQTTHRQSIDINELISDTIAFLDWKLRQQNIKLVTELTEHALLAEIDPIQIQQVIVNLLTNALEAPRHPSRQPVISITTGLLVSESAVWVRIIDNGPGVPTSIQPSLFDPFVTDKTGNMGIGLWVTKAIIEAHCGRIWLQSQPIGKGTCMNFTLPIDSQVTMTRKP